MNINKKIIPIVAVIIILAIAISYVAINNNSAYHCPSESEVNISGEYKWINCMPGDRELSEYCQPEYSKWVMENCPDIQFTY